MVNKILRVNKILIGFILLYITLSAGCLIFAVLTSLIKSYFSFLILLVPIIFSFLFIYLNNRKVRLKLNAMTIENADISREYNERKELIVYQRDKIEELVAEKKNLTEKLIRLRK